MTKKILIILGIIIVLGIVLVILRGSEDTWIKDSRGVWVKHGNPSNKPTEVVEQENLITKAQQMYQDAKSKGQDLSSGPCLGQIAPDWVADLVRNPRQAVDDLPQNQCLEYREGKAHYFIELDLSGNVVRVQ